MNSPIAAPNYTQITEMFRSAPWASAITVAGVPVKRLVDKQVRISLAGDGTPSTRSLVPETKAAERLLAGPQGQRVSDAIRGFLSLADQAGSIPARFEGVAFADTVRGVALNAVISMIGDPGRSGLQFPLRPDLAPDELDALQETIDAYFDFVKDSPDIAMSPPYMIFGQNVTRRFLTHAGKDASTMPAATQRQAFQAARTMAHELNHRVSPMDFTKMTPDNMGVMQLMEEGSTELATSLPGRLDEAARAMGLPTPPDAYRGPFGYPQFVDALSKLLQRTGIDPSSAIDSGRAYHLLQSDDAIRLPDRMTDAIARAHNVPPEHIAALAHHVNEIGKGAGPIDFTGGADSYAKWVQKFDENLAKQLDGIDSIISGSRLVADS